MTRRTPVAYYVKLGIVYYAGSYIADDVLWPHWTTEASRARRFATRDKAVQVLLAFSLCIARIVRIVKKRA